MDVMDPVLVTMNCMVVKKLRGVCHTVGGRNPAPLDMVNIHY